MKYRIVEERNDETPDFYIEGKGLTTFFSWWRFSRFGGFSLLDVDAAKFRSLNDAEKKLMEINPEIIYHNYSENKEKLKENKKIAEMISFDPLSEIKRGISND